LISSIGCLGEPPEACPERSIPIAEVGASQSVLHEYRDVDERLMFVQNDMRTAGPMMATQEGIQPSQVRRTLAPTAVLSGRELMDYG
jgi:hypothetical protein